MEEVGWLMVARKIAPAAFAGAKICPAGAPQARAAFSVFWLGPAGSPFLAQGIRTLRHRELGEMELFLVPVEEVEGGVRYQAVFA